MSSNLLTILGSGFKTSSITAFFFLLIGVIQPAFGQITFDSKEELIEAANSFFDQREYIKAKPLFSQLLSQDALNADYNYRFGVCILFTEDDPVKPMPYIEGGADSPGVNNEAFYFLGKLYQLNYRFDEAIAAYSKAKAKGVSLQNVDIDKDIQACRSGKVLYNPDYKFDPVSAKTAIEKEFFRPYDFRKLKGKVIPMPPQFKTKYDEKNLTGSFVYTPMVGQTLFYASYGEEGATGKDIYRVRKLPNGEWALPVRLPSIINSKLDEDHAYYDAQNDVLYFSSQGHNSMGGSDIFQSAYNSKDDSWSAPLNLQYPYSSPFDDYLYVTDPDLSVAFFTSTRESDEGHVKVFRIALPNKEGDPVSIVTGQYTESSDSTQTKMKAQLRSNNELIGEYRTNPVTGKYVIVAEPGQGYELSVAPRGEESFEFPINLPKHYKFKPLNQEAKFNSSNNQFNVELTNYFNNKGEEDSITIVQSKTASELPGIAASVEVSKSEAAENAIADATEKGKEEARNEIAAIEKKVREQAAQDSIALALSLAADEAKKAAESAELAQKKVQARLDSLAEVAHLAALAEEQKKQQAEADRLAQVKAEEVRLDSIVRAEALAAEEASQVAELAALAQKKELVRLDSLAEVARLAAQAEEQKKQQAEADRLAQVKAEEAKFDSIARAEALAAEEASQVAELAALAQKKELARLDSLAEAEQLAAQAEEQKKQQAEADRLAQVKAEEARFDSIARAEALAAEEASQAAELAALAQKKKQAQSDSLAVSAESDGLERANLIAIERVRLDSINKAVEDVKAAARLDSVLLVAENSSTEKSEEILRQLAVERAKERNSTSDQEITEAKELLSEETESISKDELKEALIKANLENEIVKAGDLAKAVAMAADIEGSSLLDSMNAELATLLIELSSDEKANSETDPRVVEISEKIFAQEQIEDEKKAARVLANIEERMKQSQAMEQAKAEEEKRLKVEAKELAIQKADEAREDSLTRANFTAKEEELAQQQTRLDSADAAEEVAAEVALVIRNESELAYSDSLSESVVIAVSKGTDEDEGEPVSAADAFLKAIEMAEKETISKRNDVAQVEDELTETSGTEKSEEAINLEKTGDPFIDEVQQGDTRSEGEEAVEVYTAKEKQQATIETTAIIQTLKSDSVARELEFEMARAEADAMELAVKKEQATGDSTEQIEVAEQFPLVIDEVIESEPVVILQEDVDDAELIAETVSGLQGQLTPKVVENAKEVVRSKELVEDQVIEEVAEKEVVALEKLVGTIEVESRNEVDEVSEVDKTDIALVEKSKIDLESEAKELAVVTEKAKMDSLAEISRLAAEAELQIKQREVEELARRNLEKEVQDSLTKAEDLVTLNQESGNNKEVLSEAEAFMKAIEEAQKTNKLDTYEVAQVIEPPVEELLDASEVKSNDTASDESEPVFSTDESWLEKHKRLAAEKERVLNEKINADRMALGLAVKQKPAQFEEVNEVVGQVDKSASADSVDPVIMVSELAIANQEENEQLETFNDEQIEEADEVVVQSLEETMESDLSNEVVDLSPTSIIEKEFIAAEKALEVEEAVSSGVTRLFFITPAMRDYGNRKVDFNFIQDRGKRRLIQRMLAEDRGRLGVLKNIHNTRIDNSNEQTSLDKLEANTRNREVLSGLELSQSRIQVGSDEGATINWFDRGIREGITFRLAFSFKPKAVSERVNDAMDPLIEANFEIAQISLSTGYHKKLANARAEFLEYRSRGYSNMEIQAFEEGGQIPLIEVMNRAVIEN